MGSSIGTKNNRQTNCSLGGNSSRPKNTDKSSSRIQQKDPRKGFTIQRNTSHSLLKNTDESSTRNEITKTSQRKLSSIRSLGPPSSQKIVDENSSLRLQKDRGTNMALQSN